MTLNYRLTDIKTDPVKIDMVFDSTSGLVGRWMERSGRRVLVAAKAQAGKRTGKLTAALQMRHDRRTPGRRQQIVVGVFKKGRGYAHMHHEGTKPHVINAAAGRTMTFSSRGRRVTTKVVRHPGTKPNRYLTDSMRRFMP